MLHSFESELNTQMVESDKVLTILIFCCFNLVIEQFQTWTPWFHLTQPKLMTYWM